MDDFFVGDVIEIKWCERDGVSEIGIYSGVERGYCLLTTKEGNIVPFLINSVTISKLDGFPAEPPPLDVFLQDIKENRNICTLFFSMGALFSLLIQYFFYGYI